MDGWFWGKATAIFRKCVRAVEEPCHSWGIGCFQTDEASVYSFSQHEKPAGAPLPRLKNYLEAIGFYDHVFSIADLEETVTSKGLTGRTIADVPGGATQALPVIVEELHRWHTVLYKRCNWSAVVNGALQFAIHSRAWWTDAMHCFSFLIVKDDKGFKKYLEASLGAHRPMHDVMSQHQMLLLGDPATGVVPTPWADRWLQVEGSPGIAGPFDHRLMMIDSIQSLPKMRPLSTSKESRCFEKTPFGRREKLSDRSVSAHSMGTTMLSYAAKFGLDAETRLPMACQVGAGKLLHTYSLDAAAQVLQQREKVLETIRQESFRTNSTRSGNFMCQPVEGEPVLSGFIVLDLTGGYGQQEFKREETQISEEAASSPFTESEETFPESLGRLFGLPTLPDGYVFWQHRELRTLQLEPPEYEGVFVCNQ